MPSCGNSLVLSSLTKAWGSNAVLPFSDYSGSIRLVSFIEIDKGWSWLQQLKKLYDDSTANLGYAPLKGTTKIVAVVFRHAGTTSRSEITTKIGADVLLSTLGDNADFRVLVDPSNVAGSPSFDNLVDYAGSPSTDTADFHWSYLVGKDIVSYGLTNAVADLFQTRGSATAISFSKIVLMSSGQVVTAVDEATGAYSLSVPPATPLAYAPALPANTRAFAIQRLKNLVAPPRILESMPASGAWLNSPSRLATLGISFSKPMNHVAASLAASYALSGSGLPAVTPLAATNAVYPQLGNFLDKSQVEFSGSITDAGSFGNLLLDASTLEDTYGQGPSLPADLQLSFKTDLTQPAVDVSDGRSSDFVRHGEMVTITATFAEANGIDEGPGVRIGIGTLLVSAGMTMGASNLVWTYSWLVPTGLDGIHALSFLAFDRAGNAAAAITGRTSYHLDNTQPTVTLTDDQANAYVRQGDLVHITATFVDASGIDEADGVKISIGGALPAVDMTETSNLVWTYDWTVPPGDDGPQAVTLVAHDLAGNAATAPAGRTSYTIDNIAPAVILSDDHLDALVRDADSIRITASFVDATGIDEGYGVKISLPGLASPAAMTRIDNLHWRYDWNVPAGHDGVHPVGIDAYDLAGNAAGAPGGKNGYTIDNLAPGVPVLTAPEVTNSLRPTWSWGPVADAAGYLWSLDGGGWSTPAATTSFTPATALGDGSHTLQLRCVDAAGNLSAITSATVKVGPLDLFFVLDYSGTMDSVVSFDGTPLKKVEWVKEAVSAFNTYLMAHLGTSHVKVGIILYSTEERTALELTPQASLMATTITDALVTPPTRDMTAMGKGLAWALSKLGHSLSPSDYGRPRAIVLMADGQQNIQPFVLAAETDATHDGMDSLRIDAAAFPAGCPPGFGLMTLADGRIPIHSFGIGNEASWLKTLADISDVTNAVHQANADVWPNVMAAFVALSPSFFPDSSPQVIRNGKESFQAGVNRFPLAMDAGMGRLIVSVYWAGPVALEASLLVNGQVQHFTKTERKGRLFIGQLSEGPAFHRDGMAVGPTASGKERARKPAFPAVSLVVSGAQGAAVPTGYSYLLSVVADEKETRCEIGHGRHVYWVGERIPFDLRLWRGGKPLAAKPRIDLIVKRPELQLADLIMANPAMAADLLEGQPGLEPEFVGSLLQDLSTKPEIAVQLAGKPLKPIVLRKARGARARRLVSGGWFTGDLVDTSKPGSYTFECRLALDEDGGGSYQRLTTRGYVVLLRPDPEASTMTWEPSGPELVVTFTPKDASGRLLGPGYGEDIKASLGQGHVRFSVLDCLDGSYVVRLPRPSHLPQPKQAAEFRRALFDSFLAGYLSRGSDQGKKPAGKPRRGRLR